MQGAAADLMKLIMVAVQKTLYEQYKTTKVIVQMHDELVFVVPDSKVKWVRTKVPLLADGGFGPHWQQAY